VIGDGLRSRTDERRATEVNVAVHALNRMLELGRPISVRIARTQTGLGLLRSSRQSLQHGHRGMIPQSVGSPPANCPVDSVKFIDLHICYA